MDLVEAFLVQPHENHLVTLTIIYLHAAFTQKKKNT